MIQFKELRLQGFKSFVDRAQLHIGPGLNGIVGPNGCGKSNLLESLRWVMGENSAKRMRGGGMEDVIFSGTDKRAARNIAEVSLLLDNQTRTAPAAYNQYDEIEVTRKIERDRGSLYKINGKTVRARDVQMLFADTVTGANSPAMISQGRVAEIINAKPHDRRLILEESAGISGLYARRHEAELRLKAADNNLIRTEDIIGSMETRLSNLKRQARQATKYKNLSAQIRQMEILIAYLEWKSITDRMSETRAVFNAAESTVAEKLGAVTQLTKTQNVQMEDLPALRKQEAEAAARLQTLKLNAKRIEEEAERMKNLINETKDQIEIMTKDKTHEAQTVKETVALLQTLEQEHTALIKLQKTQDGKLKQKEKTRDDLDIKVKAAEEKHTSLMQGVAEHNARKNALEQQIIQNENRLKIAQTRKAKASEDLSETKKLLDDQKQKQTLKNEIKKIDDNIGLLRKKQEQNEHDREDFNQKIASTLQETRDADLLLKNLQTEMSMLTGFIDNDNDRSFQPMIEKVKPDSGFEKALSRALGDALMASLDYDAPMRWVDREYNSALPPLPDKIKSLNEYVKAPDALKLALSQIGVVDDEDLGANLFQSLKSGQSLVSKTGMYWRWDGFIMQADASDRNAQILEQKNKLADLLAKAPAIEKAAEKAKRLYEQTKERANALSQTIKNNQNTLRESEKALRDKQAELSRLEQKYIRHESDMARFKNSANQAQEDIDTLNKSIIEDRERFKVYTHETSDKNIDTANKARVTLQHIRQDYQNATRAFDLHRQEENSRMARLHAIADERVNLKNRSIRAQQRLGDFSEREIILQKKYETLINQPKAFDKNHQNALDILSSVETQRYKAAEQLVNRESEVTETSRALKQAESALGQVREERAAAQATLSGFKERHDIMVQKIKDQFDMEPSYLPQHAAIDMDKQLNDLDGLNAQKEKLIRERDSIGAVNLRADQEAQDLEKEVTAVLHERNDLVQAIDELRTAIAKINKEARERLINAFGQVNAHFQNLFVKLFGGGRAYLELVNADDPLGAGLEIYASPPGKAMQFLSLLSGGEQALTSIALIFGMFLTNPSPICVLDEIDAPLDDANVDRVCNLLEEISARGETRFLIITHHRMTMARMNCLYGVTMGEKGVSQLVSVDMQQSFEFLDAA